MKAIIAATMTLSAGIASRCHAENTAAAFSENRRSWLRVKSLRIESEHSLEKSFQGIHHVYANGKAADGLRTGRYADGSILVFDLAEYRKKDNALREGKRKLTGVMQKKPARYRTTGGRGFEALAGDSKTDRLVKDGGASCVACHVGRKTRITFSWNFETSPFFSRRHSAGGL